jgi:hypothetical protein
MLLAIGVSQICEAIIVKFLCQLLVNYPESNMIPMLLFVLLLYYVLGLNHLGAFNFLNQNRNVFTN